MKPVYRLMFTTFIFAILQASAWADNSPEFSTELAHFQNTWAEINYSLPKDRKEKENAFEKLSAEVRQWVARNPESAETHIWQGVILSTYAGARGGLGALSLLKEAKKSLEQAISLDPNAMAGSAYMSLGTLYYQVPGWPLSFGDNDKAADYLTKALSLNPNGIEPNFFYADYLKEMGEYAQAKQYFEKALQAELRPKHLFTDTNRRTEIKEKLNELARSLSD